jgi:hypothetical protein
MKALECKTMRLRRWNSFAAPPRLWHPALAACVVAAGNLPRKLLQQPHPQWLITLKSAIQDVHREKENQAGILRKQRVGVPAIPESGCKFDQISGARQPKCKPGREPFCLAHKLSGANHVKPPAYFRLAKDDPTQVDFDALGRGIQ